MTDEQRDAAILRHVAVTAVADAKEARRLAGERPTEDNLRAALRLCVLAARALRRASEHHADEEVAMLDRAALFDETAVEMRARLVRLIEPAA